MKVLGLTGGIGMGKSQSARLLHERRIPVADTDLLAREVVAPGQPALSEIAALFGAAMVDASGQLRRSELAKVVFANPEKRRQLERIVHPRIRERWMAQLEPWRQAGHPVAVVVIPLLFETRAEEALDAVICVACSQSTQWQRLRARGWSDEEIRQRLQAQWPIEKKMTAASYVIWTEGTLEVHAQQLDRILFRFNRGAKVAD